MADRKKMLMDRIEIMSILCSKSSSFWHVIKISCVQIPLIITSSVMALLNAMADDGNNMRLPNIIVNSLSVFLMSLNNQLKIYEKADGFNQLCNSFTELLHAIEGAEDISAEQLMRFVEKYDDLVKQSPQIPQHIKSNVRNMYGGKKHLPIFINGIPVVNEDNV